MFGLKTRFPSASHDVGQRAISHNAVFYDPDKANDPDPDKNKLVLASKRDVKSFLLLERQKAKHNAQQKPTFRAQLEKMLTNKNSNCNTIIGGLCKFLFFLCFCLSVMLSNFVAAGAYFGFLFLVSVFAICKFFLSEGCTKESPVQD